MVDFIPYGSKIAPNGKLVWPESEFEMTVIGFGEVCVAARKVTMGHGLTVPVITVPGFILLKIIAYLDRRAQGNTKYRDDAKDIEYWLRNYASSIEDGRRFELAKKPGLNKIDYETAGAVLLGIEVKALASAEAVSYIDRFLQESNDPDSPFIDALAAGSIDVAADKKRTDGIAFLAAFKKGYLHQQQRKE